MAVTITSWQDLTAFGINALTGEACKHGMRLLCDLDDDGTTLISEFFGLACDQGVGLTKNWNSQVNGKPALASVMLPRSLLQDLGKFALLRGGYVFIVQAGNGCLTGYTAEDVSNYSLSREKFNSLGWDILADRPVQGGSRNTHAFTGRTI